MKVKSLELKLLHVLATVGHPQATVKLVKIVILYFNLIKMDYFLSENI
jgi:hypothetical protein